MKTISEAAKAVGIKAQTLRLYDRLGLVIPIRDAAGNRLYTERDIELARSVFEKRKAAVPWRRYEARPEAA